MTNQMDFGTLRETLIEEIRERVASPVLYELGCGQTRGDGFVGLDLFPQDEGTRKCDLYRFPWAFSSPSPTEPDEMIPDQSVDYIRASHFVEHIPDWDAHFEEAWRVLKPGGYYEIVSPYYTSVRAWQDPDHKQPISEARFMYLDQRWLRKVNRNHYGFSGNFHVLNGQAYYSWHNDYVGKEDGVREHAKLHSINVVEDIALILVRKSLDAADVIAPEEVAVGPVD